MTKTGTENPNTANIIANRSIKVRDFHAASTPSGIANTIAMKIVNSDSISVGSTRWPMSFVTGRLEKIDTPRSP